MATTITWTIEQIKCLPKSQGQTDVVNSVSWRCSGTDGQFNSTMYGSCAISYTSTKFTPYEKLTEEQICEWVWANGVDKQEVEKNITGHINKQKNPTVITLPLPWSQE